MKLKKIVCFIKFFINVYNLQILKEIFSNGVGYFYEGLSDIERKVVEYLFFSGVVQVLVVFRSFFWGMSVFVYLVVVMDIQYYDGKIYS